jgi:hypothetical protein
MENCLGTLRAATQQFRKKQKIKYGTKYKLFKNFTGIKTSIYYWWDIHRSIQNHWKSPVSPTSTQHTDYIFHFFTHKVRPSNLGNTNFNFMYSSRNDQQYTLICTTPLFYKLAPTCFSSSLWSSGSLEAVVCHQAASKLPGASKLPDDGRLLPKHVGASL